MNIGITGATGFIGRRIVDLALQRGHEVIAFSRDPSREIPGCAMRRFSLEHPVDLRGCHALIHLAGEPIAGLWTPGKKRRIEESRCLGTRQVVHSINSAEPPPEVFVCGSGIACYADCGEREVTERSPSGTGFLAGVVQRWEAEANKAQRTRVVLLRTAPVLGKRGGLLAMLAPTFRVGLGARLGNGEQWMSWIHIDDEARLALFAVENMDVVGPLNAAAPWPVQNSDFTRALAAVLRRPAFLRIPVFALRMAGDLGRELMASKRVVPAAAIEYGFAFQFSELEPALRQELA